jgi:sulfoxide reductase heme-binding subunit YedZ
MTTDQRYRWLWKPALFLLALSPAALMTAAAFGLGPASLGVDPVKALVHRCGLTALQMLWLTLAITPLRQLTGNADLQRLRRMLGLFAAFYTLLHFTAYAWLDQDLNLAAIGADIVKRPYITIGMLALLMMLPLAVTSTNAWMRRLRSRWQRLHRLVYPIAVLATWHFWWQVKKDYREPLLYAALLAVLLGWRLMWRLRRHGLTSTSGSAKAPGRI